MVNTQDERKAFESAYSKAHKIYPSTLKKYADGSYYNGAVRAAFRWWIESAKRAEEKREGCVVVPVNNITIVAIERMVEQQVEASGIKDDVFRLDGEKILNAAVEAARGGNE